MRPFLTHRAEQLTDGNKGLVTNISLVKLGQKTRVYMVQVTSVVDTWILSSCGSDMYVGRST